jgi:hypothetical protein
MRASSCLGVREADVELALSSGASVVDVDPKGRVLATFPDLMPSGDHQFLARSTLYMAGWRFGHWPRALRGDGILAWRARTGRPVRIRAKR